jgi:hypothetical protein
LTPSETVVLARYVKACCPQQAMDEFTPNAWHDLLDDLELDDCRAAVAAVAKRQPFVAPAEIRAEVKRIRDARIAAAIVPAPPAELTDEPGRYNELIRANVRRIADAKNVRRALAAGPLPGDPPQEWLDAKAALAKPPEPAADPRQKAREQVEELRRAREAGESA